MRILIEVWSFAVAFEISPQWTRWYLPISFVLVKAFTTAEIEVNILWLVQFSFRFPLSTRTRKQQLKSALPRYR